MSQLDDLVDGSIIWSKRPDKVDATRRAIRDCVLKFHRRHKFFRDLSDVTTVVNPTPGQLTAIIDIATNFPRFRQFAFIRKSGFSAPLTPVVMDDLLDSDGYARQDIYLVAGTNLNVSAYGSFASLDVVYYQDPDVLGSNFSSWIADRYPSLIEAASAARVLSFDNESEIYKAAKIEEQEQWATLVSENLEPQAR